MDNKLYKSLLFSGIGILAILTVVLVITIISNKGELNPGKWFTGEVSFSETEIDPLLRYPNATLAAKDQGVAIPEAMKKATPEQDAIWNQYVTEDVVEQVNGWYNLAIGDGGYHQEEPDGSGIVVFTKENTQGALYVISQNGKTYILLSRGSK